MGTVRNRTVLYRGSELELSRGVWGHVRTQDRDDRPRSLSQMWRRSHARLCSTIFQGWRKIQEILLIINEKKRVCKARQCWCSNCHR